MNSDKLLDAIHRLVVDRETQEQFARTPLVFLSRLGIAPETARVLAPVLTTMLAGGVALATGGNGPEYQWQDPPHVPPPL